MSPTAIGHLEEAGWTVEVDGEGNATGPATRGDEVEFSDPRVRARRPSRTASRFMELLRDQVVDCGIEINVIEADFATVLLPLLVFPHVPPNADRAVRRVLRWLEHGLRPGSVLAVPLEPVHRPRSSPTRSTTSASRTSEADALIDEGLVTSPTRRRERSIYQQFEQIIYDEQPYLFAWSDTAREAIDVNMQSTAGELELGSPLWDWQYETLFIAE